MRKRLYRIDPTICPACRSVQTELLSVDGMLRTGRCRMCHKTYIQYFRPCADSPYKVTDEAGRIIWDSVPPPNPYND